MMTRTKLPARLGKPNEFSKGMIAAAWMCYDQGEEQMAFEILSGSGANGIDARYVEEPDRSMVLKFQAEQDRLRK
jgi:hypothetical protein